jgi:hypothetical protein
LCEAYMGIEPQFNMWNYFYNRLRPDSDAAVAVWGHAEIYVCIGLEMDPYFHLSISISLV